MGKGAVYAVAHRDGGILFRQFVPAVAAFQKEPAAAAVRRIIQLIKEKRDAVIQHKETIIPLCFHLGKPLHGNDILLFQIGGDGVDIVLKGLKLIAVQAFFRYIKIAEGHNEHDDGGDPCAEQCQPQMYFFKHGKMSSSLHTVIPFR